MSVELVVARFNENLNWLKKYQKNLKLQFITKDLIIYHINS